MGILDQIQNGPFTTGPEPEWVTRGKAFLETLPPLVWERTWEISELQWDPSIEMYAIIDTEGNVRGWIGERALKAIVQLAEETQ